MAKPKQDAKQQVVAPAPQVADGRTRRARREEKRRAKIAAKRAHMTPHGTARKLLRAKMPWEALNALRLEEGLNKLSWKQAARKMGKLV